MKKFIFTGMAVIVIAIAGVVNANLNTSSKSAISNLVLINVEALGDESNNPAIDDCYTSISQQPGETQKESYVCNANTTPEHPRDCPSGKIWIFRGTAGKCYPK
jgi:hypothetical protein